MHLSQQTQDAVEAKCQAVINIQNEEFQRRLQCSLKQCQIVTDRLQQKSAHLSVKSEEARRMAERVFTAQRELDDAREQYQIMQSEHLDRESHYKKTLVDLQKESTMAGEADLFMKHISTCVEKYVHGETVENLYNTTPKTCSVCLSAPANVFCKPCNHMEWCSECASKYTGSRVSAERCVVDRECQCPRCRAYVTSMEYVFL